MGIKQQKNIAKENIFWEQFHCEFCYLFEYHYNALAFIFSVQLTLKSGKYSWYLCCMISLYRMETFALHTCPCRFKPLVLLDSRHLGEWKKSDFNFVVDVILFLRRWLDVKWRAKYSM